MTPTQIREYLEFYRDLGFDSIYRLSTDAPFAPILLSMPSPLPSLVPQNDTLDQIRLDIGDCKRCRLCEARTNIVFGSGNEKASLVFVGEGPGADEDEQGLPFVGRAGQLLT